MKNWHLGILLFLFCFCFFQSGNAQTLPDFVITGLKFTIPAGGVYTGATIDLPMDVTIRNTGTKDIIYSSRNRTSINILLKTNEGSRKFYASGGVKTLRRGQSELVKITLKLPATVIGKTLIFSATVDPCNEGDDVCQCPVGCFAELNDNNNAKSAKLKVPPFRRVTIPKKPVH